MGPQRRMIRQWIADSMSGICRLGSAEDEIQAARRSAGRAAGLTSGVGRGAARGIVRSV
jgi:hypothetical protein